MHDLTGVGACDFTDNSVSSFPRKSSDTTVLNGGNKKIKNEVFKTFCFSTGELRRR